MQRHGNRLHFAHYNEPPFLSPPPPLVLPSIAMPRPRSLDLPSFGSSSSVKRNRVAPSPRMRKGGSNAPNYLIKILTRKFVVGMSKSKLRGRLLKRGLNSPRTPFFIRRADSSPPDSATLPITLPKLSFPLLFPATDSGYCSDASRSPSPSPAPLPAASQPTRRYILPDPQVGSPLDLFPSQEVCVRLSAHPALHTYPCNSKWQSEAV
ncbi:hypothetical protein C8F01DRAFT_1164461 [Mycena amicta]|nr:hypothetical protein C8F01DRAFT_1164461 [Mycena amicta]